MAYEANYTSFVVLLTAADFESSGGLKADMGVSDIPSFSCALCAPAKSACSCCQPCNNC